VAHGARNYWKSHHLKELTDDCIDKILEYVNFLSEGENRAKEAYTPRVWNRLVEVKRNWDPQNLFRINQNIKP
jgi:hypothetical protein